MIQTSRASSTRRGARCVVRPSRSLLCILCVTTRITSGLFIFSLLLSACQR
jgi:hypothetical protein